MEKVSMPKGTLDPYFRYKRIVLQSSIISKSGGNTTVPICDLNILSKNLDRESRDIINFIKKRCKTNVYVKDKVLIIRKTMDKQELEMARKRIRTIREPGANGRLWLRVTAYSKSISNSERKSPGLSSEWCRRMLL